MVYGHRAPIAIRRATDLVRDNMTEMDEFLSVSKAARYLGMSEPTLRRRIRDWRLAIYLDPRDRRRRLVRAADVAQLGAPRRR